ncbi:outer membrane efflux family protein [Janthinobacterium agaricidamnosum NBRC 102515 = DSM 9628]|uniref:Outer membrane efflux family protein n=1 Tax=Janthinobacterium agaricidamnosum NBRC 102515 = DSM 9628 TaxID=1349767 RepID=W0V7D4_9BURK|nr:outer membrane efflux family protein [Janthinobacterium agaricidamnosum NBRC 102515 = DSM 9628]
MGAIAIMPAPAMAGAPTVRLSFADALEQASAASGAVQGAALDARAKTLKAQALSRIDGPSLDLTGFRGRLSTDVNLDTSRLSGIAGGVEAALPGLPVPDIPNAIDRNVAVNLSSFGLRSIWPLYTGGRLDAIKGLAAGLGQEAEAEQIDAEEKLATSVAQRYFQLLLAQRVVAVRAEATAGIAEHQGNARKLELGGLISRAERLRADVALAGARSDEAQARSDLEIAQVALNRLLNVTATVQPGTPLFVHSLPVGSLQSFIDTGMRQNAAWKKIDSKRHQAQESLKLQGKEYSPTVFAVGNYNLNRGSEKLVQSNWMVGVAVSVPLVGRIDTGKMIQAAKLDQERVEVTAQQAGRDIPTLIEKQWRALENARIQFMSSASSVELARENIKLQAAAFKQGQATSLDEIDARLNLARIETQRAQTAYHYVMALAQLLEASGQPRQLSGLANSADILFPVDGH